MRGPWLIYTLKGLAITIISTSLLRKLDYQKMCRLYQFACLTLDHFFLKMRCTVVLAILVLLTGCWTDQSLNYSPKNKTYTNMKWIGRLAVIPLVEKGFNPAKYKSYEDMLSAVRENRIMDESEINYKGYHVDAWGNAYRWEVKEVEKITVIRISSDGPDGIFQNGDGDDLYVEIRNSSKGKAILSIKNNPQK